MTEKLQTIRKDLLDALEEDDKLNQMGRAAQQEVEQILANGKPGDELENKRYGMAALTLQMLPSRRAHVVKTLKAIQADGQKELRAARSVWNGRAAKKRKEVLAQACDTLRPFYVSNLSRLTKDVERLHLPAILEIERASDSSSFGRDPSPRDVLKGIETFLARVNRLSSLIGDE